jgi:hypothetical protein
LQTLPAWGLIVDGELLALNTPAQFTEDKEYGFMPTPNARDYKGSPSKAWAGQFSLPREIGGVPHPEYAEELMLWPIGWTDLEPLAMDKCPLVSGSHGMSYPKAFADWLDSHGVIW